MEYLVLLQLQYEYIRSIPYGEVIMVCIFTVFLSHTWYVVPGIIYSRSILVLYIDESFA